MDIRCPICCEPCEIDTVHEYVSECREMFPAIADTFTFQSVYDTFISDGCGVAFEAWKWSCEPDTSGRGAVYSELAHLLGDDVDGFASMCEDFEALGGAW